MTIQAGWQQALTLLQQGQPRQARDCLLAHPLQHAEQEFLLGVCAHALQEIPQAVAHFTQSLQLDPAHARAAAALGALLAGLGRHAEAEQVFRQGLHHQDAPQVRFNLAVVLEDGGRLDDAHAEYSRLLQQHPDHYAARHNRAGLHARRLQLAEAGADYRELIQRHPGQTRPWQNLADIEISQGHYEAALTRLEEVVRREPGNAKAMMSLAIAAAASGQFAASEQHFDRLKQLDTRLWQSALDRINGEWGRAMHPEPRLIFLVRQHEHLAACDWSRWPLYGQVFQDFVQHPGQGERLSLMFRSQASPLDAEDQQRLARSIAEQIAQPCMPHMPAPTPSRLRIGYLAASFGDHVMGQVLRRFFAAHDQHAVEIFVLSLAPFDGSTPAEQIRRTPGLHWQELTHLDDAAAADHISALQLDVLVDLAGYNDNPRPGIMARRPAPVQVSWLCATYTSGAPWLDYYLADPHVRPGNGWCSEAEVLLPECYFVFSHDGMSPATTSRKVLGLPDNTFVFACLNGSFRIEPDTFTVWMNILRQTPDSVLWLLADSSAVVLNLKREAEWRGIDPHRLLFTPRMSPEAHQARFGAADLYLDTRYYNGHTTVAQALWSGLPVLTCPGRTFASRVAGSLLHSCALPELVMPDWTTYEQEAVALYHDRTRLHSLRERLASSRLRAAPFNLKQQARHIESAFRHMRQRFANGLPPAPFNIVAAPDPAHEKAG